MKQIICGNGPVVLVSDSDYGVLSKASWTATFRGKLRYAVTRLGLGGGRSILLYMHRLIMDPPIGYIVDHANADGLDNRRENLRLATESENRINRRIFVTKQSKYRGVSISQAPGVEGKWVAFIGCQGMRKNLGYFNDESAAARAYDSAAVRIHGEFAKLNFPGKGPGK